MAAAAAAAAAAPPSSSSSNKAAAVSNRTNKQSKMSLRLDERPPFSTSFKYMEADFVSFLLKNILSTLLLLLLPMLMLMLLIRYQRKVHEKNWLESFQ